MTRLVAVWWGGVEGRENDRTGDERGEGAYVIPVRRVGLRGVEDEGEGDEGEVALNEAEGAEDESDRVSYISSSRRTSLSYEYYSLTAV